MDNQRMLLKDFCYINPKTELRKNAIARKISMADLPNNARKIRNYSWDEYAGGIKFQNNDTIMARITPCLENGKGGFVDILSDGEVAFGSTEYIIFRAKESVSHPEFIYYFINTKEFRDIAIKSMTGTSGRQRVQTDLLADMAFQFPDYETQERIAYVLSSIDKKISLNDQLNDNLKELAHVMYSQIFVTNLCADWQKGTLSDLITIKYGKDHKKLADGNIPVYGSGGIMRYVESSLYTKESVLIPRKGTLNNVIYINEPFWSVDTMFYTEMKKQNIAKYIYHFISSKDLASMNAGSAVPSMTTDILNRMVVSIPPQDILESFEEIVTPLYQQMAHNIKEITTLAEVRDTLLPKLMTGELNLDDCIVDIN